MIYELWTDWISYLTQGGFIMWPLVLGTIILWYAIGYRFMYLKRGSDLHLHSLIHQYEKNPDTPVKGWVDNAVAKAVNIRRSNKGEIKRLLEDEFFPILEAINRHSIVIRVIVLVAPLAGLLGTVVGMIEMFDSLGSQTFYSQSGGVANGISKALFTTQMGLVIAIPGMIIGRFLERKENRMKDEIAQLKDYYNAGYLERGMK
ncbi:MAG: MotA/TolQ/ExbB proton channel family protein [Spirochaetales bacterium]|nr:MotA/TolQ/ExbB proton channel family protein [Spirochaetales bacterium]